MATSFNWSPETPIWIKDEQDLLETQIEKPLPSSLDEIIRKSDAFPLEFPIDTVRCKTLKSMVDVEILQRNINSVYPVVHENVLHLYAKFILHKRRFGSTIEKSLYQKMNLIQFIERLLRKRAVTFMGKYDFYILLNGKRGKGNWESIGTTSEKFPLLLKDCLSYEEVKLSTFLSVSSYTHFINVGDRKNFGLYQTKRDDIQQEGIIIGIMGARLVKPNVMEYEELVLSERQNTASNGYGKLTSPTIHHLFAKFYEEECLEFKDIEAKQSQRYTRLNNGEYLDNLVYYKRLLFTIDTLLMEANYRALERNTTAYIHVVGIGLGVWKKHACQSKIFMDSFGQRIKTAGPHLHNVSDICFAYIPQDSCLHYKHGDIIPIEGHPLKGIKIHISKRDPHSMLNAADRNKLLIVSYAWDGNALPGNEFWNKKLGSSGDSAAASSTQISELHNPFINPLVCGDNLKVATKNGIVGLEEYAVIVKRGLKRTATE